jgi:hypothetical protein
MYPFLKAVTVVILLFLFGCKSDNDAIEKENIAENIIIKGKVQSAGTGISGVVVTDGTNFTQTDENGSYSLPSNQSVTHVHISSPSGFSVPVENSVPLFYSRITSQTNVNQVNFLLIKTDVSDQKHFFVAIGDPQVRNETELTKYKLILDCLKSDINSEELNPLHMMVVGDIVFDTPAMHSPIKSAHFSIAEPFYYAIGNHDHSKRLNQPATDSYDKVASEIYTNHYGPTYYSFNRGQIHYLVLDNILYRGGPENDYSVNITDEQLNWVKKDLSYVPKEKALVVMVHAPTKSRTKSFYGNCNKLHELVAGYKNVQIISGHTHYNSVVADATRITEHIVGAACGGWWEGPVCTDGTYLGYKIFEIDGTSIKWKYRACNYPGKQFSVFKPGIITSGLHPPEELLVNVWDWDLNWKVTISENNGFSFTEMSRIVDRTYDPVAYQFFGKEGDQTIPIGRGWIDASTTDHIFSFIPSINSKKVIVKVINHFGEEFTEVIEL